MAEPTVDHSELLTLTSDIVAAHVSNNSVASSDLPSLIKFLHAVSVHPKFLVVEEFNLASFRVKGETRIQPRMQISGYIRLS